MLASSSVLGPDLHGLEPDTPFYTALRGGAKIEIVTWKSLELQSKFIFFELWHEIRRNGSQWFSFISYTLGQRVISNLWAYFYLQTMDLMCKLCNLNRGSPFRFQSSNNVNRYYLLRLTIKSHRPVPNFPHQNEFWAPRVYSIKFLGI